MAETTGIEWCDATFNPWWGCERVSPGCAHCYADTLATRYGFRDAWGVEHGFRFFGDKHWAKPLKWARTLPDKLGRRPRVFCASMADVFEERDELNEHRARLFRLIADTPELDWLILTKRPEVAFSCLVGRMRWSVGETVYDGPVLTSLPPNVWLGVSIENARFTWRADVLRAIPAAVRFISAEPLLGSLFTGDKPGICGTCNHSTRAHVATCCAVAEDGAGPCMCARQFAKPLDLTAIDWLIIGGESGPRARTFHLEHAREILDQVGVLDDREDRDKVGRASVFVKQLGAKPVEAGVSLRTVDPYGPTQPIRDAKGGDWSEWPADLRIREFPRSAA